MKMQNVKTWKERPARETEIAMLDLPEERVERAPPEAWRMRERMSQGMKSQ